jgi:hypothetical protein
MYRSVKQLRSELTSVWLVDRISSVFSICQRLLRAIGYLGYMHQILLRVLHGVKQGL